MFSPDRAVMGITGTPRALDSPRHVDVVAVLLHLVHKVERYDHRPLQLQKLGGQVEVALNVGGVDDVDDGVGPLPTMKSRATISSME